MKIARLLERDMLVALMRPHSSDFIEGVTSDLNALFGNLGTGTGDSVDRRVAKPER